MSNDRYGGERLSGEVHQPEAAARHEAPPRDAGPARGLDSASALERLGGRIGEALRQEHVDEAAERAAVAAFRSARPVDGQVLRTRRRDDWRPRTRKQRWARGGVLAFVASALLGGIAFASISVVDTQQAQSPDTEASHDTRRPTAQAPGEPSSRPAAPGTASAAPSQHPDTAKNVEAHCRAYERIKDSGHALDATAWQRLVQAAGGEAHVTAYCARLTSSQDMATPAPTKADKTPKGQAKSSAKAKPSKEPSGRG